MFILSLYTREKFGFINFELLNPMGIMANTNLTNQRQVFVHEYVGSGDHLEAVKKAGYKDTHTLCNQACKLRKQAFRCRLKPKFKLYLIGGRASFRL